MCYASKKKYYFFICFLEEKFFDPEVSLFQTGGCRKKPVPRFKTGLAIVLNARTAAFCKSAQNVVKKWQLLVSISIFRHNAGRCRRRLALPLPSKPVQVTIKYSNPGHEQVGKPDNEK